MFMKQLKGCRKDDEVKGIQELKDENSKGNNQSTHANDDDFDELLDGNTVAKIQMRKGNRTLILLALSLTIHLRLSSRNQSRCHKSGCESVSNMGSVQILKIEDYANADIKISFEVGIVEMGALLMPAVVLTPDGTLAVSSYSSVEGAIMFPSISAGLPNVGYKVQVSLVFIYIGPQA